jgi:D-alanyl-D-alanine carboxypeptidase (penicillin-binding protein 5/6)
MLHFIPFLLLLFPLAAIAAPLTPRAPEVSARAWLLVDMHSGQTLVSRNADRKIEPASLTKLMTAYLVFDALKQGSLKLDEAATISEPAWRAEGSRMFVKVGSQVPVEDLIKGMIVQSGNDATIALAEAVAGDEGAFAELMNRQAAKLGMKRTHFVNSTGLPDPAHTTTAEDLALLAQAIIRHFPEYYRWYSLKEFTYNNITQPNRNRLLWADPNVDGVKTGHTESAGFCLIASAKRGERRLLSVVTGTASDAMRAAESQKLLNWGFRAFDSPRVYAANQAVSRVPVYRGKDEEVNIGFVRDLVVSVPRGAGKQLAATMTTQQPMLAPIARGQRVGTLTLTLDGKTVGSYALVALKEVKIASIFGRAWDSLRLMLR